MEFGNETRVLIALDVADVTEKKGKREVAHKRAYFVASGADFTDGRTGAFKQVRKSGAGARLAGAPAAVVLYPTRTFSRGFGGTMFSDIAPEDRAMIRSLVKNTGEISFFKIPLSEAGVFERLPDYLADEGQRERFRSESRSGADTKKNDFTRKRGWRFPVEFDFSYIRNMGSIFRSCMTKPNKQDFFYLVTKTFGVNLIVRVLFAVKGVRSGNLPLVRAVLSTSWYQLQDIVFTIFGQTYMKFLGRMTGMLRVWRANIGDFLFVYVQFCFFEFLNRLILGPIGENPLVYTWQGIALILLNNLQGLVSGGPLVPAINKLREAGLIGHSMMMHLYQLGSLCFYFGLFASFGYQTIYAILTGSVLVFAWGSYIIASVFFKDVSFGRVSDHEVRDRLDAAVGACYLAGCTKAVK